MVNGTTGKTSGFLSTRLPSPEFGQASASASTSALTLTRLPLPEFGQASTSTEISGLNPYPPPPIASGRQPVAVRDMAFLLLLLHTKVPH